MIDMTIVLLIILVVFCLYILSTICRRSDGRMNKFCGWKFAHRGLHGKGIPENSMEAFRRAKDRGYGVELDIHLLADGNLAVIHDSDLIRTTGVSGQIEDLKTEDLQNYYLEGTLQTIPEFKKVLELFDGCAPLIVELKAVGKNYAELCEKTCEMLDAYQGDFCLESFDPRCVRWLYKNRPDLIRGQLTENFFKSKTSTLPWIFKFLLTNQMLNFLTKPDFVAYKFKDRKHFSNKIVRGLWQVPSVSWTLLTQDEMITAVDEGSVPIFEGFEP